MLNSQYERIETVAKYLKNQGFKKIDGAVVLGSGLSEAVDSGQVLISVPFKDIPGFPQATVSGHKGELVLADVDGKRILFFKGRIHRYEGHNLSDTVLPIRTLKPLGVKNLMLTCAAGAISEYLSVGELMVFADHINGHNISPLMGENLSEFGPRFLDMSRVYDAELKKHIKARAIAEDIPYREGIYVSVPGPQYETPAEIRMWRVLGADAIGMSTVPEAIVARHQNMRVTALAMITNKAAGTSGQPGHSLSHEEVEKNAAKTLASLKKLIDAFIGGCDG